MADDKFNAAFAPKKSGGSPAAAANKAPAKADARSDPKADAKAARKAKKKRSRKVLMLCLLIVAILLGGAGYALYRIGMLDPILVAVGMMPSPEELSIEERQSRLDKLEIEYAARGAALDEREEAVERREKSLRLREEEIERRESAQTSFVDVMTETSPEQLDALKKVSKICNQMSAEDAVGIVQNLANADEIALVVYHMTEEKAAQLLTLLPQVTAAKVLSLIID